MLSMWALFVLAAMIVSWALDINTQLALSGNANRALEAEAMACSGAEVAMHPAVEPGSPLLKQRRGNAGYDVRITGEGGRINLNWIAAGENLQRIELLRRYLEIRGIDLNERDRMIDCLLDWIDPDNLVRLNGAENEGDYRPRNAPLRSIDELKQIRGWEKFTASSSWDNDFTLAQATGPIDLLSASREVLLALPDMSEARVDDFLSLRRGPDGIDGTSDDGKFANAQEILSALGLSTSPPQWAGLIGFSSNVFRVVSTGRSGDVTRIVQMVLIKANGRPQLLSWKEL